MRDELDYFAWLDAVLGCKRLTHVMKVVVLRLQRYSDGRTGYNARPGHPRLAEDLDCGLSIVGRALRNAEAEGLIAKTSPGGGPNELAATYLIGPEHRQNSRTRVRENTGTPVPMTGNAGTNTGTNTGTPVPGTTPTTPTPHGQEPTPSSSVPVADRRSAPADDAQSISEPVATSALDGSSVRTKSAPRARGGAVTLPDDWRPDEPLTQWTETSLPGWSERRLEALLGEYRAYHRSVGTKRRDWDEAWRAWVLRQVGNDANRQQGERDRIRRGHGFV